MKASAIPGHATGSASSRLRQYR